MVIFAVEASSFLYKGGGPSVPAKNGTTSKVESTGINSLQALKNGGVLLLLALATDAETGAGCRYLLLL